MIEQQQNSQGHLSEVIEEAVEAAEKAARHPFIIKLARWGFYTKGYLFIIIGVLAVFVALGLKNGKLIASSGALATVAQLPFGGILLFLFIVGAIGHGFWNILRGVADIDEAGKNVRGIAKRIIAASIGVFYLLLAWTAWSLVVASRSEYTDQEIPKTVSAIILALPLGSFLMVLVGLGIIGAGVHECYSGITGKFKKNLKIYEIKGGNRRIIDWLGYWSFTARALIFALMGYFFIWAAIDYNPNEAIGLDGALKTLSQSYYGKTLLLITAFGLISHGFLALYEGRYRRVC